MESTYSTAAEMVGLISDMEGGQISLWIIEGCSSSVIGMDDKK